MVFGTSRIIGRVAPRQINDRVEQIEAPNHTAVPMVCLDIRFTEDPLEKVVELAKRTDDDETKTCLLRLDVAAFGSQTGVSESSAGRALALTPFRLRAFSSRGSPSAEFTQFTRPSAGSRTDGGELISHCASPPDVDGNCVKS